MTGELDREHDVPRVSTFCVQAPKGMGSHAAMDWMLTAWGTEAYSIECMGTDVDTDLGDRLERGRETFRVTLQEV